MGTILRMLFLFLATITVWGFYGCAMAEPHVRDVHGPSSGSLPSTFLQTPLHFEANQGQTDPQVQFLSRGNGYNLFLTPEEAVLTFTKVAPPNTLQSDYLNNVKPGTSAVLRMRIIGGNPTAQLVGEKELQGQAHYFIGNDPAEWHAQVPIYGQVRYSNIYPGIDLVYYGNQRQLEYDFVVAPGEDPSVITMDFDGLDTIELEPNGDLALHTSSGIVRQRKPVIYQEVAGRRQEIQGEYRLKTSTRVGFQVAEYDSSKPLIIDPVLVYSTYLGGSNADAVHDMAIDAEGNVYVMGLTLSTDFPVMKPLQPSNVAGNSGDFFVTKFSPNGSTLIYATYLGGNDSELGRSAFTPPLEGGGMAVDSLGQVYITGTTASTNFPVTNALQATKAGRLDAFVAKLAADGSRLMYSTYLGGATNLEFGITPQPAMNRGNAIAIDTAGNAYITGVTDAQDFPTVNAFQSSYAGGILVPDLEGDAFVTKITPDGSALVYSSYLGGEGATPHPFLGYDEGVAIAVDHSGSAYVTGITAAADFPTLHPFQATKAGVTDIFLTKFTPEGSVLAYSTFLGGSKNIVPEEFFMEHATGIELDTAGHAYLTGWTYSEDFPIVNAFQPTADVSGENRTCFITKFTDDGSGLEYSTYLSGTRGNEDSGPLLDRCKHIAVDTTGNAYVTGETSAENFPVTADALQTTSAGNLDAFVTKLTPDGSALAYSSYLGGTDGDRGTRLAVDAAGTIFVSGQTGSPDFPTMNAFQASNEGNGDGFLMKFAPATMSNIVDAGPSLTMIFPNGATLDGTVKEDKFSATQGTVTTLWSQVNGPGMVTFDDPTAVDTTAHFSQAGTYVLRLTATNRGFTISDDVTITVNPAFSPNQAPVVNAGPDQTIALSSEAILNGSVTDDGVPGGTVTTTWSTVSGPGPVNFGNTNGINTPAHFSQAGTYVLRLTANDGLLQAFDEVSITVNTVDVLSTPYDLNGDGTADLVWRNRKSGALAVWLMNGTTISASGFPGSVPAQWKVEGIGDVNGDGKADVIWKSSSNVVAVWLMDGLSISSVVFPGGVSPEWTIEEVGDFNGDGKADMIWRNTNSGQVAVWLMNGGNIAFSAFVTGLGLSWEIAGVGDVDDDGKADVFWRNTTSGAVAVWFMDGLVIRSIEFLDVILLSPEVKIRGVGDVDGDGKADLVWQNDNNHVVSVWLMNGKSIRSSATVGSAPSTWNIQQVADVNGNGKADVIWQNTNTGDVSVWLMNGTAIESVGFPGAVSPEWEIQP